MYVCMFVHTAVQYTRQASIVSYTSMHGRASTSSVSGTCGALRGSEGYFAPTCVYFYDFHVDKEINECFCK